MYKLMRYALVMFVLLAMTETICSTLELIFDPSPKQHKDYAIDHRIEVLEAKLQQHTSSTLPSVSVIEPPEKVKSLK